MTHDNTLHAMMTMMVVTVMAMMDDEDKGKHEEHYLSHTTQTQNRSQQSRKALYM